MFLITLTLIAGVTTFFYSESSGEVTQASKSEVPGAAYPSRGGHTGDEKTILNLSLIHI